MTNLIPCLFRVLSPNLRFPPRSEPFAAAVSCCWCFDVSGGGDCCCCRSRSRRIYKNQLVEEKKRIEKKKHTYDTRDVSWATFFVSFVVRRCRGPMWLGGGGGDAAAAGAGSVEMVVAVVVRLEVEVEWELSLS